ncbi:hypothetical protein [Haloferula rosea]|uniref:Uncharacterized protein n=1 Tax=Haloferula rosea TaxID=490093 RepID=A0A934RBK9_9BACT|nr:hypothetical protein [Haloferula rosea]MBK1825465.1 hypothetical protein [Haloferula rosea]
MVNNPTLIRFLAAVLLVTQISAYEVWIGTHLMRSADANDLPSWSLTASQVDGFNVNRAPHDTDPASNQEYRTIFQQFTNAESAITEFARSQATRDPEKVDELAFPSIAQRLEDIFSLERNFGYELTAIMFYDERGTFQGTEYLYEWTDTEIQYLRDWLDDNGHSDIELKWNVRNNSVRNQQIAAKPIVDSVEIEASTTALLNNTNNQITFFTWYWNNPATANKPIALQIPRTLNSLNQFKGTRRVAEKIGGIIGYGDDGMRSDRLIFLPVTYNDNYDYLPETVSNGANYTNTLTSIALSLIEQRTLFEGRVRVPTIADADSTTRLFPPTVDPIADQIVPSGTSTGPLAFSVGDDATPASDLTISKSSSNTSLVSEANIVFGGSGANRTVEITPEPGQSGSAEIELWVGDGTLGTPVSFTVTVLPPGLIPETLYSLAPDCSIKENLELEKQSSATVDVGSRGSGSGVERCTVYVFQLPDLGVTANPFQEANFTFNYVAKSSTLRGHDLYGLGRRSSPTPVPGDYYAETTTADPTDATRLQQAIMNNSTPLGLVTTTAGGSANLAAYLNAQYAGGAGAGEYVFLRINTRDTGSGVNYATLTMSEGGASGPVDTRPRIRYTATNPVPTITSIPSQTLGLGESSDGLSFAIGDDGTPAGSLALSGLSSDTTLVPNSNIVFGGSGANRTVTVTPAPGLLGSVDITIQVSDGTFTAETNFTVTVEGTQQVMAGWDFWSSDTAPDANVTAAGIIASASASTATGNWSRTDDGGSGRGSSGDQTWGSFGGNGVLASAVTSGSSSNLTALNGVTDAELTLTVTNNGPTDWELDAFHMDVIAFRPNAPRTYELEVVSGDVTQGVVFTSADDEISELGGSLSGSNDDHDEVDIDLSGLADSTLETGGSAVFRITFSSGTGSGGGHHLFLDNVAVSGATVPLSERENWRFRYFGTIENSGVAADGFDVNDDGESNLLEFATGQDPHAATRAVTTLDLAGGGTTFRYARSKAALADGFIFQPMWSDSLAAGSWSTVDLVDGPDPRNPDTADLEFRRATMPLSQEGRRFFRLEILEP